MTLRRSIVRTFDGSAEKQASCLNGILETHLEGFAGADAVIVSLTTEWSFSSEDRVGMSERNPKHSNAKVFNLSLLNRLRNYLRDCDVENHLM